MVGTGRYSYANHVYDGHWTHGSMDGFGYLIWPNNVSHTGQWSNGIPQGMGTRKYQDGATYTGEWLEGEKHGKGVFTAKNGNQIKQTWVDGTITNIKKKAFHQMYETPVPLFEKDSDFVTHTMQCMVGIGNFGSHGLHL